MTTFAVATQSILASLAVNQLERRCRSVPALTSTYLPRQHRKPSLHVWCLAEKLPQEQSKVSTKFEDVLAFSGPAPEKINGRLVMVGFMTALVVKLAKGDDLLKEVLHRIIEDGIVNDFFPMNKGLSWFVGTTVLLSIAYLIPLFKGVSVESKSDGVMMSGAELWNGRFAMIRLVVLVLTEFVKGKALV